MLMIRNYTGVTHGGRPRRPHGPNSAATAARHTRCNTESTDPDWFVQASVLKGGGGRCPQRAGSKRRIGDNPPHLRPSQATPAAFPSP
jgi:hypothetical protein